MIFSRSYLHNWIGLSTSHWSSINLSCVHLGLWTWKRCVYSQQSVSLLMMHASGHGGTCLPCWHQYRRASCCREFVAFSHIGPQINFVLHESSALVLQGRLEISRPSAATDLEAPNQTPSLIICMRCRIWSTAQPGRRWWWWHVAHDCLVNWGWCFCKIMVLWTSHIPVGMMPRQANAEVAVYVYHLEPWYKLLDIMHHFQIHGPKWTQNASLWTCGEIYS
jgi:hypothetical protein